MDNFKFNVPINGISNEQTKKDNLENMGNRYNGKN